MIFSCHSSINLPSSLNPFLGLCAFPRTVTHRGDGNFLIGVTMKELIGKQFGRWAVVSMATRKYYCLCQCACGVIKPVHINSLERGHTQSCGCLRDELARARITHGMSKTNEFKIWQGCKKRCYNTKTKKYPKYGGRGIKVCPRWLESFSNFYQDMGHRPSKAHSIHRINNDGDYEPSNCKWATNEEQQRNKTTTKLVTYRGLTMTLVEHAKREGVNYKLTHARITRGCSLEEVFEKESLLLKPFARPHGESHWGSVLNESKVLEIRKFRRQGKSWSELAEMFNASRCAVRLAAIGKTWTHVKELTPT